MLFGFLWLYLEARFLKEEFYFSLWSFLFAFLSLISFFLIKLVKFYPVLNWPFQRNSSQIHQFYYIFQCINFSFFVNIYFLSYRFISAYIECLCLLLLFLRAFKTMNIPSNTAFTAFCEVCYVLLLEQFSKLSQYIDFISSVAPKLLYKNIMFF